MEELARLDPPGCGCTDCLTGYSKPLDEASGAEISELMDNGLQDATGVDWEKLQARMDEAAQQSRRDAVAREVTDPVDPNAALAEIREAIEKYESGALDPEKYADYLTERVRGLDRWLTRGAFFPDAWEATVQNYIAEFDRQHEEVNEAILAEHANDGHGCCVRCVDWQGGDEPGLTPWAESAKYPCATVQLVQSRQPEAQ